MTSCLPAMVTAAISALLLLAAWAEYDAGPPAVTREDSPGNDRLGPQTWPDAIDPGLQSVLWR
jgi:hypothetical protein